MTGARPLSSDAEAASDAVRAFVQSLYPGAPAPAGVLFHYTSLAGLMGVLKTGELWASELRSLNDTTELTRGFDLLARAAALPRLVSRPLTSNRLGAMLWIRESDAF